MNEAAVEIVKAGSACDYRLCADIWLAASLAGHDFIDASLWRDNHQAMAAQYLPASEVWLLRPEGREPLAFAAVREGRLEALFVSPDHWGSGLGRRLLSHVLKLYDELELTVYARNARAIRFYSANGFQPVGQSLCGFSGESEVLMRRGGGRERA